MKSSSIRIVSLFLGCCLCVALLAGGVTQEVARGNLRGVVRMQESGKALPKASISLEARHELGPEEKKYRTLQADEHGEFSWKGLSAGAYVISAYGQAHTGKEQQITIEESETTNLTIDLEPNQPYLQIYSSQRVFSPNSKPSFQLRGFAPATSVKVDYYRLDLRKIAASKGLKDLLYSFSRPGTSGHDPAAASTQHESFKKDLLSKDIEGVFTEPITMPTLAEGFYYVRCTVGNLTQGTYINVSQIGLVTKSSGNKSLCYVADVVSGKPIAHASIQTLKGGKLADAGETNADGVLSVPTSNKDDLVVARSGKSVGVVDVDLYDDGKSSNSRIVMYTDRPIYRPGDKVQFKGIIRNLNGSSYAVPPAGNVSVEVLDTNGNVLEKMTLPLNNRGTFVGSYTSNREDAPGEYSFQVKYGNEDYTYWFNLSAYRKPDFSIDVNSERSYFIYGDQASAKVKCTYYFGGPVVGARVEAYITRTPHYSYSDEFGDTEEYDDYAEDYYPSGMVGEYREKIDVTTDEKGEAIISFPTRVKEDTEVPTTDFDYQIVASISDASGKFFDGTGTVPVVRGDVDVIAETDDYVAKPNQQSTIRVTVTDRSSGEPLTNYPVKVELGTETWQDDVATYKPLRSVSGTTDSRGVAAISFQTGEAGSLVLKSSAQDRQGRTVASESYLYVDGDNLVGPPSAHFTLTLNKRKYKVGETCKALIQTSKPGSSALMTVEANGVLSSRVVKLDKAATSIEFPVTKEFEPNVFVSVCSIQDRQLSQASSRLVVTIPEHKLNVKVSSDKESYRPGDSATLTIRTTNSEGRPVSSEVSVGVVDESIYAIRPDRTNLERDLYPMRGNSVSTSYSFEEIYLDGGDKGGGNIQVRSDFRDTADWQPQVLTDDEGFARVTVKLPDNLTSWRTTVWAISDRTQVGSATTNFRVNKPLMVRLSVPAFMVKGDRQEISASITNNSGQPQVVAVRLDAQGIDVQGASPSITVSPNQPETITWTATASTAGTAKLTVYAVAGDLNDAEERSFTIKPLGLEQKQQLAGVASEEKTLEFQVSPNAARDFGRLRVTVSPSILSSIYQSLDHFIDFPYGCVEQTMSRFLPTVVLSNTLDQVQLPDPGLKAKIPAIVEDGFSRLAAMRHPDNAWGWWLYDSSDPYMTAYVLDGLQRAKEAGYETTKINPAPTLEWVKTELKSVRASEPDRFAHFYLAYIAVRYGIPEAAAPALKELGDGKNFAEWAMLALIRKAQGDSAGEALAIQHVDTLLKQGDQPEKDYASHLYGAEPYAWALRAYVDAGDLDKAASLAERMMQMRTGNFWYSTRDSAIAVLALTDYVKKTRELGTTFDVLVKVNGRDTRHLHFSPTSVFNPDEKLEVPLSDLQEGHNTVQLLVTGGGKAYYSLDLRQVVQEDQIAASQNAGLMVSRSYYLLEPRRMEDGSQKLVTSRQPVDRVNAGDLIRVQVSLVSTKPSEFLMVEDPIPSNCRVTDREYVENAWDWTYWWSQLVIRDDKVAFFVRDLPVGLHKLEYTMRAEQTGRVTSLPVTVENMYAPTIRSNGASALFEVQR